MAAGRDMVARLVLTLTDRATAGLRRLQGSLSSISGTARRMAGLGALAGAFSFATIIPQAAAFEDTLRQTAITAGRSGAAVEEMIRQLQARYETLALQTRQRSRVIAEAAQQLFAAGLDSTVIDQMLPTLARAATATGATMQDLSNTAIALNQNLRIGPAEMADALAALAQAGKEGRFELRDMARSFPQLTAAAEALGLRGRAGVNSLAAMLQVARRGAATADEAANNLANFLQKISSPETVKHFREMGVNIEAVLADAARKGINPVEAVIEQIRRVTRGNMFRVGELFGDLQVLNFLRPILGRAGLDEYRRVLEAAAKASRSLINTDFESRARGMALELAHMAELVEQIGRRFALAAGQNLPMLNNGLEWLRGLLADVDKQFPGVIDGTVKWTAALVALVAVFGTVGTLVGLLNPIGVAIGVVAAGALLVAANWKEVEQYLGSSWRSLRDGFNDLWDAASARFRAFVAEVKAILEPILAMVDRVRGAIDRGLQFESPPPLAPGEGQRRFNQRGRAGGFYGDDPAVQPQSAPVDQRSEWRGRVEIALAPGLVLRRGETDTPGVTLGPDRGLMLRPV